MFPTSLRTSTRKKDPSIIPTPRPSPKSCKTDHKNPMSLHYRLS